MPMDGQGMNHMQNMGNKEMDKMNKAHGVEMKHN